MHSPEVGNHTNLQYLSLEGLTSCIVENVEWLSRMSDLSILVMDGISLGKVDKWVNMIRGLQKLSFLSLSGCNLSQVMHPYSSSFLNSSSSIDTLYLDDNNLNSSMYQWLLPLTSNNLRKLDISKNMLDGKSFGNLCSLTSLDFAHNSVAVNLRDFFNNWSGCTSVALQNLYASYSRITGSLSDEIQMFTSLEDLYLDHNELNGPISEKVWELPKLQSLGISSNYLRVAISENIMKSKLNSIDISNNSIIGVFSEAHMPNFSYVNQIGLSSCNLGPRFPKWILNFKNLTNIDIANNRISDTIPEEFWKNWPSQLTYLNLSTNHMNGEVTDLLSGFHPHFFSQIDLSSNNFSGQILNVPPICTHLDLSRNKFHGGLSFLCQIPTGLLRYLDLSHNSFIGKIPDCLSFLKELEVLNLGYNNLSGMLPASVEFLTGLEVLSLYNNNFSGELPL
ncbi:receptor-like protein EIX1 [Bidens hawaiensis]|uniref:receptor-like protein EIX1 n=1 Tax=Bidens hawaiensis TaxID=980011 RepID=UPI004049F96C